MKRIFLFILFVGYLLSGFGQEVDSVKFDKHTYFEPGIYTNLNQLFINTPKYYDYKIISESKNIVADKLFFFDNQGNQIEFNDTVFAYIEENGFYNYYKGDLHLLSSKGSISIFFIGHTLAYGRNVSIVFEANAPIVTEAVAMYYFDIKSGVINWIQPNHPELLEPLFVRDKELYDEFSNLSKSKKKKRYYSYILKYNERNPFYVKKANP